MEKNTKPKDNNIISNKLLKVPKKTNKKDSKKYELINIVSETRDSIYTPDGTEVEERGQIYINLDLFEELSDQLKLLLIKLALLRKDLVSRSS